MKFFHRMANVRRRINQSGNHRKGHSFTKDPNKIKRLLNFLSCIVSEDFPRQRLHGVQFPLISFERISCLERDFKAEKISVALQ